MLSTTTSPTLAQHGSRVGFGEVAEHVAVEFLALLRVDSEENVTVAEAELLRFGAELEAMGIVLHGHISLAPGEEYSGIDDKGEHEVHQHAADHDEETLPRGFRAELPGLFGLLELLRVHRLVDHARNLHVAAQGKPADAVGRVAVLGLELEGREPGVEEEAELLDAHLEEFREQEVAAFVEKDEQGKAEDELECSDEEKMLTLSYTIRKKILQSA